MRQVGIAVMKLVGYAGKLINLRKIGIHIVNHLIYELLGGIDPCRWSVAVLPALVIIAISKNKKLAKIRFNHKRRKVIQIDNFTKDSNKRSVDSNLIRQNWFKGMIEQIADYGERALLQAVIYQVKPHIKITEWMDLIRNACMELAGGIEDDVAFLYIVALPIDNIATFAGDNIADLIATLLMLSYHVSGSAAQIANLVEHDGIKYTWMRHVKMIKMKISLVAHATPFLKSTLTHTIIDIAHPGKPIQTKTPTAWRVGAALAGFSPYN
jgi:hypothetical protein